MNRGLQTFLQHEFCLLYKSKISTLKRLCTEAKSCKNEKEQSRGMTRDEAYRQLENLDFKTAARMLFTDPPKPKKFGLDFHLVQLFFACLPSLAVYLVAQYARSEMKRMDAERHRKQKQAEDEEKAREAEKLASQERSENELVKVKGRLDVLEEKVKEIADQTKQIAESIPSRGTGSGFHKPDDAASSSSDGGINSQPNTRDGKGLRALAAQWGDYFRDRQP